MSKVQAKTHSDLNLLNIEEIEKIYSIDEIKNLTYDIFKKYGIKKAYLFGSYARKEATKDSDIDFLIEGGNFKQYSIYSDFIFELVSNLKKEIDIVRQENYYKKNDNQYFDLANKIFFDRILKERILIYE